MNVAVVTGAASGIGLAITQACLKNNMHVVMADLNEPLLLKTSERLRDTTNNLIVTFKCDVSQEQQVNLLAEQVYEKFGAIELLINNAGIIGEIKPSWELTCQDINKIFSVNVYSVYNVIRAFVPLMIKTDIDSHIINMSSIYGLLSGSLISSYAASKHAIIAISESLYYDLNVMSNNKIQVSVACPSFVNTNLMDKSDNYVTKKMANLMQLAQSADEVAAKILSRAKEGEFYILPDNETYNHYQQYSMSIMNNHAPIAHDYEKLIAGIYKKQTRLAKSGIS